MRRTIHGILFLLSAASAALAADTPSAPAPAKPAEVECEVTVQSFGTYFDPKGALNYSNPASRAGWIIRGLRYAIFALKGANTAENWYEGRGILTAYWSVSLKATKGTLPHGQPAPRNFKTSDNTGQAGYSAHFVVEQYAKDAGCTKSTFRQEFPALTAWGTPFREPYGILSLAFTPLAYAGTESLAPVPLADARASLGRSLAGMGDALAKLGASGCVRTGQLQILLREAQAQAKKIAARSSRQLDHLDSVIAEPMTMEGAGVCQGAFSSMMRELDARSSEIASELKGLSDTAKRQFRIVDTLTAVGSYEVRDVACAATAFRGMRASVRQGLAGIGSFGQLGDALETKRTELAALRLKQQRLLASCGQGKDGSRAVTRGQSAERKTVSVPSGSAKSGASDITGGSQGEAKQPR